MRTHMAKIFLDLSGEFRRLAQAHGLTLRMRGRLHASATPRAPGPLAAVVGRQNPLVAGCCHEHAASSRASLRHRDREGLLLLADHERHDSFEVNHANISMVLRRWKRFRIIAQIRVVFVKNFGRTPCLRADRASGILRTIGKITAQLSRGATCVLNRSTAPRTRALARNFDRTS